jgi:hypothetical protein
MFPGQHRYFCLDLKPEDVISGKVKYSSGRVDSYNEYGHKPWQPGFKDRERDRRDGDALYRFQAEWAMRHGPKHTAYNHEFGRGGLREDSDRMTEHRRDVLKKHRGRRPAGDT